MSVNNSSMLTEVNICDSRQILSSDGHSSTASDRTVQWPHILHWCHRRCHCKFSSKIPIKIHVNNRFYVSQFYMSQQYIAVLQSQYQSREQTALPDSLTITRGEHLRGYTTCTHHSIQWHFSLNINQLLIFYEITNGWRTTVKVKVNVDLYSALSWTHI